MKFIETGLVLTGLDTHTHAYVRIRTENGLRFLNF